MKYLSMKFPHGEGVETCSEGKPIIGVQEMHTNLSKIKGENSLWVDQTTATKERELK